MAREKLQKLGLLKQIFLELILFSKITYNNQNKTYFLINLCKIVFIVYNYITLKSDLYENMQNAALWLF
jgi:hypothetical protein